jgi:uncharacterized membrane protein YhaH (DUF805 family)
MSFVDAVRSGFQKWNTFAGRSSRSEYWWWALFTFLTVLGVAVVGGVAAAATGGSGSSGGQAAFTLLALIWFLVIVLPTLSVSARRLHDTNRSAWWLLVNLVPYVGSIILLVIYCLDGSPGPNRFGPRPGGNLATYRGDAPLIGVADELKKLDELKAAGTISQAEFDRQRARLLPE